MSAHPRLEEAVNWLLNHSLQAGVLVLLVMLVQWVFRRQLTSRWRFALWWIVLVRLLLPFSPASAMSVFNFYQPTVRLEGSRHGVPVQSTASGNLNSVQITPAPLSPAESELPQVQRGLEASRASIKQDLSEQKQTAASLSVPGPNNVPVHSKSLSLDDVLIPGLAALWLVGVLVLAGVVATQLMRFSRKVARASAPAAPCLQTLFDECQREFGLSGRIKLVEADAVQSPALFGLLRLRLLLPRGIGGQFAARELRYIFLHELAHVKRGDLWVNWLVTALQIMHWFNPLLWLGFARLRVDRELACDELALLRAGDQAGTAYGRTVVKLLENLNRPTAIPGLVGILEDKEQMRRRISMIAAFRRPSRWSALALFLVAALAVAALTDPQLSKPADKETRTVSDARATKSEASTGGESGSSAVTRRLDSSAPDPDQRRLLDHSRDRLVSGRVIDAETKEPIGKFRGAFGWAPDLNRRGPGTRQEFSGTNGVYLIYVSRDGQQPTLQVEAEGYLPERWELMPGGVAGVDFALRKGSGPSGIVLTPDGKPAVGATAILLGGTFDRAGFDSNGKLMCDPRASNVLATDSSGRFAFKPIWGMHSVAAATSTGFAIVGLESLATNPAIRLEPFGKITGTLNWTSRPATNEQLHLKYADGDGWSFERIYMDMLATTDTQGHFGFSRVPAGHLRISYVDVPRDSQSWSHHTLRDVDLRPGETLDLSLIAADPMGTRVVIPQARRQPQPIPDVEVKGVVLLPDGRPAANAEVALQVEEGIPLIISNGVFAVTSGSLRQQGTLVNAGDDGVFSLLMYEGARSVVALSEEGFAQVPIAELKALPSVTLERWGRIEGTLRVGDHAGSNEFVNFSAAVPCWSRPGSRKTSQPTVDSGRDHFSRTVLQPPIYDPTTFHVSTDDQGRFVIPFVPPGRHVITRFVSAGGTWWTFCHVAAVDVKPGETTVAIVGGHGRTVSGKVKLANGDALHPKHGMVIFTTESLGMLQRKRLLKNDAERQAFYQSAEVAATYEDHRLYSISVSPDGSFRASDVLPGKYAVSLQELVPAEEGAVVTMFDSLREFIVPEAGKGDGSTVDWGEVKLGKVNAN